MYIHIFLYICIYYIPFPYIKMEYDDASSNLLLIINPKDFR